MEKLAVSGRVGTVNRSGLSVITRAVASKTYVFGTPTTTLGNSTEADRNLGAFPDSASAEFP
ncbi:MAG: hypothetical protein AB2L11_11230 [Syntrophobacteraceae bacterium]